MQFLLMRFNRFSLLSALVILLALILIAVVILIFNRQTSAFIPEKRQPATYFITNNSRVCK